MEKRLLSATTMRRVSCPRATQQIWDAIKIIRYQRQVPNLDRISRYMSRVHNVKEDEVSMHLNNCVSDNLIRLIKKVGSKGSKIGVEQEGYGLPKGKMDTEESDWYCFECQASGDVICCTTCHRVFHLHCLNLAELPEEDLKNTFVCPVCKKCDMNNETGLLNIKQQRLNRLVRYICAHVSGLLPAELTSRKVPTSASYLDKSVSSPSGESSSAAPSWETDSDDAWRSDLLIRRPMDMSTMQAKAAANGYRRIEQFQADVHTLLHNVVIYHGPEDDLSLLVRRIVSDVTYDVAEVRQCADCYAASNEQRGKTWFCRPCRPPHELVWAKQKTFPFWPAKVIRVDGAQYDVRFFGGQHQRAMIPQSGIRPIETSVKTLQVKRTAGWTKACEELRQHQQLLEERTLKGPAAESSEDEDDIPLQQFIEDLPSAPKAKRSYSKRTPKRKKVEESDAEQSDDEDKARKDDEESAQDSQSDDSSSESTANERIPVLKEGQSQEDMVSSSCQEPQFSSIAVQTSLRSPKVAAREKKAPLKAALAKARKEAEQERKAAIAKALRELEEQLSQEHLAEIQQLKEEHAAEISEVKLKQWCFNCEKEAIYHCCWNTAYCSIQCQQEHWTTEHKPHCRRKR